MTDDLISTCVLAGDEVLALGAIEVTAIPHISIIDAKAEAGQILQRYKAEFQSVLAEIFQSYRAELQSYGGARDISLELLWKTTPVKDQPYNADIQLYLIVRAIAPAAEAAKEKAAGILNMLKAALVLQKYEFTPVSYDLLHTVMEQVDGNSIQAVVKEERAEFLQNQLLPYCYGFDRLPAADSDFAKLVSILTEYPQCAVSFQLIPSVLRQEESAEIDRLSLALKTLSRGVADQGVGNVSYFLAEKHAATYGYYAEHKSAPFFLFQVLVFGGRQAAQSVASRIFGQLSAGTAGLKTVELGPHEADKTGNLYALPWAVNELLLYKDRNAEIWNSGRFSQGLFRLPYLITGEEAAEFFRLPVGSANLSAGLKVNESGKESKTYTANIINSGDITVGRLRASAKGDTIGFSLKDLAKHMLVVGTPGSGKTTFSVGLLDRLWKEHHIPFLVIEPAKNEYRALVQSIPELQVFTPGKNFISPFVFNPFVPPKNVKLETYKSTLKTAFSAAVSMSTPLDKIFEETINNCYSDFRWLDTYTLADKGRIFNITDFIQCFQQTFDEIGYTGDAKNIGRAGVVRLNSLVNLFDNYFSIPIEDLLCKPTIIELAAIENSDQKSLIIALLLLSILAYVNANYVGEGGLKNVILLEEAHVLLDSGSGGGQGEADPSAIAQGLLKRMLAEIRSYGVGIVIADQSPRKVSVDVVALTDMKVVFRLVESADKQIIADSTNMTPAQIQRMSKLKPGEAFLFFNKLDAPEEVITPDYRLENNIRISLSDEGIKSLSTYWKDKGDKLRPYPQCALCRYCQESCDYNRRILAREVARRIFVHNFRADTRDVEPVRLVFASISKLVMAELNDEPFTPELLTCVKVHLWRRIKYGTKIPIRDIQIENSIKR